MTPVDTGALDRDELWPMDRWAAGLYSHNAGVSSNLALFPLLGLPMAVTALEAMQGRQSWGAAVTDGMVYAEAMFISSSLNLMVRSTARPPAPARLRRKRARLATVVPGSLRQLLLRPRERGLSLRGLLLLYLFPAASRFATPGRHLGGQPGSGGHGGGPARGGRQAFPFRRGGGRRDWIVLRMGLPVYAPEPGAGRAGRIERGDERVLALSPADLYVLTAAAPSIGPATPATCLAGCTGPRDANPPPSMSLRAAVSSRGREK